MKKKHYYIAGAVLVVVLLVVYFMFFKGKSSPATTETALGKKKDGTPYYEKDVQRQIKDINGSPDWLKLVQDKAKNQNKSLSDMLRADAIWMLETA